MLITPQDAEQKIYEEVASIVFSSEKATFLKTFPTLADWFILTGETTEELRPKQEKLESEFNYICNMDPALRDYLYIAFTQLALGIGKSFIKEQSNLTADNVQSIRNHFTCRASHIQVHASYALSLESAGETHARQLRKQSADALTWGSAAKNNELARLTKARLTPA